METSVSHKGHWCWLDRRIFCQEADGCLNCEVYVRYSDIGDNNSLSGDSIGIHSSPDKEKQL